MEHARAEFQDVESSVGLVTEQNGESLQTPLIRQRSSVREHQQQQLQQQQHPPPFFSRILDRDALFHQSRGRWGVQRRSRGRRLHQHQCYRCICRFREWIKGDWFHRLAYQPTYVLMFVLFVTYSSLVVFFAFLYLAVSILGKQVETDSDGQTNTIAFCDMDIDDHMEALYFSLSTMTTIGYGVSDYYFGGCWTPLLLVLWQVCTAITFDAVAVGLIFHRISRGRKRGKSILFSDKAVIRRVQGVPYLLFRIGELRSYHLIEATVRVYCIRHVRVPTATATTTTNTTPATTTPETSARDNETTVTTIDTSHFVPRQLQLVYPNQSLGSQVLLTLPEVIVHRMDDTSPLVPSKPYWYNAQGVAQLYPRQQDTECSDDDDDNNNNQNMPDFWNSQMDSLERFLVDRNAEIVVLIEGTDAGTGAATQARHSYKACDLAWNHTYAPCIFPYRRERRSYFGRSSNQEEEVERAGTPVCTIEFERFHDIVEAPLNCDSCAYIPKDPSNGNVMD